MNNLDKKIQKRIEEKLNQLNNLRPLSSSMINKLREQFSIEMTYNSNAIEGNKLTLRETGYIINEGITIKGKSFKDHLEAKDHYEAIDYLYGIIEDKANNPISGILIRNLQKMVVRETEPNSAGCYRDGGVFISGSKHHPPEAYDVPKLMESLIDWIKVNRKKVHSIELAAIIHHKIVNIHPFFDGNGRMARLVMNLLLMQDKYPLVVILKQDRKKYYQCLERADKGDYIPFVNFIAQAVERSLNIYLRALVPIKSINQKYISLSKLSKEISFSEKYLNLLARQGKIEAYKEGRNWVSTVEAVKRYMGNRERKRK
ncbi:MAG: Fic family protein [Candidatus Paceibacterota bacterium]|jgi:Fic family protein